MTEKPAKTPWSNRATKSWVTEVTSPMAAMITAKPTSDRIIISFRPTRSARMPQTGARTAATLGVTARSTPDQMATRAGSVTPSSCT